MGTDGLPDHISPIDLERPSLTRAYDYLLGGQTNWAVDRWFAAKLLDALPQVRAIVAANRAFLRRAVRHLLDLGVDQFVDVGSGAPGAHSTHGAAEQHAPGRARVVYVDNDPVGVAHSRVAISSSGDPARHAAIAADLRSPDRLWHNLAGSGVIDLRQPVAMLFVGVLHVRLPHPHTGTDLGESLVARYRELLPSGSYLVLSHATTDSAPPGITDAIEEVKLHHSQSGKPLVCRDHDAIQGLFGDFTLLDPGLTWTHLWHPESAGGAPAFDTPSECLHLAGIAHKP